MDCGADVFDRGFEDAMRGWVGDHQRGEVVRVGGDFRGEIGDIDVAVGIAGDGDDFEAAHGSAGGIGTVGAGGDEADVAVTFVAGFVIRAGQEEAGVFALGAGIGLERDGDEAGEQSVDLLYGSVHRGDVNELL